MKTKYINSKTGRKYEFYSRQGVGTDDVSVWGAWMREDGNKIVKQEYTWLGFWVSTVWIGIDYNFSPKGRPLIFETMVFLRGWSELDMDRYSTEKQALEGHKQMVWKWSNPFYVVYKIVDGNTWRFQWWVERQVERVKKLVSPIRT